MRARSLSSSVVGLILFSLIYVIPIDAATLYWDTTSTDVWSNGADWSNNPTTGGATGSVPLSTDSAYFSQSSKYGNITVQLDGSTSIFGITFANTGTTLIDANAAGTQTLTLGTGGLTFNRGAGAVTIGHATNQVNITLDGAQAWTNNSTGLFTVVNGIDTAGYGLTVAGNGPMTVSGAISNSGSLTKNGNGLLTLSGINTFSGGITVNSGQLTISGNNTITGGITLNSGVLKASTSANALGGVGNALTLAGGVLQLTNGGTGVAWNNNTTVSGNTTVVLDCGAIATTQTDTMGTLSISAPKFLVYGGATAAGGTAALTYGATTLSGNVIFEIAHNKTGNALLTLGTVTVSGPGNADIVKSGNGSLSFSSTVSNGTGKFTQYFNGVGNTLGGTTTFNNAYNGSGAFKIYGGSVQLTGATATLVNTTDVELLGGTLTMGVAANAFLTNRLNAGTDLTMGGGRLVDGSTTAGVVTQSINSLILKAGDSAFTGAGALTHTLSIGSMGTRDIGSIINFDEGANFPVKFVTAPTLNSGGIIGGWATYGADFATHTGNNTSIQAVAYNGANINTAIATDNINPVITNTTVTLLADKTIDAMKLISASNTSSGKLDLGGHTLTIDSGGLIFVNSSTYSPSIINGTLTAGSSANAELFLINAGSTTLLTNLAATIADNGAGAVNLVRGGNIGGALYLSGDNTYTGKTILGVRNDVLNAGNVSNLPTALTYILTERQLGAMPTPGSVVADKLILNNGSIQFNPYVNPSWAPERGITLGGLGGTIYNTSTNVSAINLSAPITGTGPLYICNNGANSGNSMWTLSGNNTFDGQVELSGNQSTLLNFTSIGNVGGGASSLGAPTNAANGTIHLTGPGSGNNNIIAFVGLGAQSSNRDFLTSGSAAGNVTFNASGSGILTLTGNDYWLAGINPSFGGTGIGILSGNIIQTDSATACNFAKTGAGTWQFTGQNTFSGTITMGNSAGTLEYTTISNANGGPSSLGTGSGISIGGSSSLRFIGSTNQTSDRPITITGNSATVDASGTDGAVLNLTGGITGAVSLVLRGTGAGIESGIIGGGATALTKIGSGTWTLNSSASNTYTGTTSIAGGNLILDFSNMATPTNLLPSGSALAFSLSNSQSYTGGGTLTIQGGSGQAVSQTFASLGLGGAYNGVQLKLDASTATSVTLNTGNVTRGTGVTLDIETIGTTTINTGTITLTGTNLVLPYATYNGNEFATGVATGGAISAFNNYAGALTANSSGSYNSAYTISGALTKTTTSFTTDALKITATGNNQTFDLGTYSLTNASGIIGVIYDGTGANWNYTISGTGTVGNSANELVFHVASGTLTISANLGITSGIFDKAGEGTLILSGNNSALTGTTAVNWGTLQAGSTTAFSSTATYVIGPSGTLSLNGYNNTVKALGVYNQNNQQSTGTIINGSNTTAATLTIKPNLVTNTSAIAGSSYASLAFTGTIADGGSQPLSIVYAGTSQMTIGFDYYGWNVLTNVGNSFTGSMTIQDGVIEVASLTDSTVNGPLGAGSNIIFGSTSTTTEGILLCIGHNTATNRTITLNTGSAGGFQLSDTSSGAASNMFGATMTLTGKVTGGGTLDKLDAGNLVLTNATNDYTGGSIVRGGILQFASGALPGTGNITVVNGGTVAAAWNFSNGDFLTRISTSSVGVVALGANNDHNLDFTNYPGLSLGTNNQSQSFLGTITPNSSTYRLGGGGVDSALIIQNANTLTGANSVVISNAGSAGATVVYADAQDYSGATTIGGNFHTATTTVSANGSAVPTVTLILAGQNATIANSTAVNLNPSGVLRIVDSVGAATKIKANALQFNGGTLQYYVDSPNGNFSQSVGNLNLNRGANYVAVNAVTTGTASLTFSGLTRTAGSTIDFNTAAAYDAKQQIVITGSPALGAWATYGAMTGFAAYDATNTTNVIKATETTWASGTPNPSGNYVNIGGAIASGFTTASLTTLRNTAAATISMGAGDTINSNAFMANSGALTVGNTIGTGTVAVSSGTEMFFYTPGQNITVNANITGAGTTLVKAGASTLTLFGTNTYTDLVINQGTVTIGDATHSAGLGTGTVTLNGNGATLGLLYQAVVSYNNNIVVNADSFLTNATGSSNLMTLSGNIALNNNASLDVRTSNGAPLAFSGVISGNGGSMIFESTPNSAAAGDIIFNNATTGNTYTGLTQIIGSLATPGSNSGQLVILQQTNAGVAIAGDILLGKREVGVTPSNLANRQSSETLRIGNNYGNQIADTSLITFAGGDALDAGVFQLYGNNETIGAIQSQGPSDGVIENGSAGASILTLANNNSADTYTFSGMIRDGPAGTLGLTKNGAYKQILAGTNTYTGATTVNAGTLVLASSGSMAASAITVAGGALQVNGTISGGSLTVNSGGTAGGTGTIACTVTIQSGGYLLAGNGTAGTTLTVSNNLTLNSGNILQFALGPGLTHSVLARTGGTWTFAANQMFDFIDLGATVGTYSSIITGLTGDPGTEAGWQIDNAGWTGTFTYNGGNIDLEILSLAIPEPSTYLLFTFGAAGILAALRRRSKR